MRDWNRLIEWHEEYCPRLPADISKDWLVQCELKHADYYNESVWSLDTMATWAVDFESTATRKELRCRINCSSKCVGN